MLLYCVVALRPRMTPTDVRLRFFASAMIVPLISTGTGGAAKPCSSASIAVSVFLPARPSQSERDVNTCC